MRTLIPAILLICLLGAAPAPDQPTTLVGRVTDYTPDPSGQRPGIHGVEVEVVDPGSDQVLATTHTDPSGRYEVAGLLAGRLLDVAHRKTGYINDPTVVQVRLAPGAVNELGEEVHLMLENPDGAYRARLLDSVSRRVGADSRELEVEWTRLGAFELPPDQPNWLLTGLSAEFGSEVIDRLARRGVGGEGKRYVPEPTGAGGGGAPGDHVVLAPEP